MRCTAPYARRCANARSRSSSSFAAVRNARSAYAPCSKTRSSTSYAARRAGLTTATEIRVVAHAAAAGGLHLERLESAVVGDLRAPHEQVAEPRADVRRERAHRVHVLARRTREVELAVGRRNLLRRRRAVFGLQRELRPVLDHVVEQPRGELRATRVHGARVVLGAQLERLLR